MNKIEDFNPKAQEQIRKQLNENRCKTTGSFVERPAGNEPLEAHKGQEGHSGRLAVVVTSFRRRLLDEDNLAEKYHVDACRYAGIIHSDAPGKVRIKATQQSVKTKEEERTEIDITPIYE